ncbi:MAG TPA: mechanosensitive ion channel family protein [Bacillota bacterium]|nr:mechanosensitive ion channel family protein [Bacillota bacterium]HQE01482.1 mechanosensitive ion channel family protein [Bacillota bacterium]
MNLANLIDFWKEYLREYTIALGLVLLFYALSRIFSRYIVRFLLYLTAKTEADYDEKLVLAFKKPLARIIICTGLYLAGLYLLENPDYQFFLTRLFRSALIIFIAQGLYNLVDSTSGLLIKLGSAYDLDKLFLSLLSKTIRAIIFAISFTILVQEWGYDITGFVAGLGIGGLAFALAAQDTIANVFGGIVILTEKPFTIGDWIVSGDVEGTVEDITFRSTKVRTFAHALITMPNSILAKQPITNWSRMGKRRVSFNLRVRYSTPRDVLQRCLDRIRELLANHDQVHPDTIFVNLDKFGESSLEILVYFFTKTTVWARWLEAKESILFAIMKILEEEGASLALPSRSIYIEQDKN